MQYGGNNREDTISHGDLINQLIKVTSDIVAKIPTINPQTAKYGYLCRLVFLLKEAEKEL